MNTHRIYIFLHVIIEVEGRRPLLKPSLRAVYFSWLKKHAMERGIQMLKMGGSADHVHLFIQLHPAQNLLQVVKWLKEESLHFINESKLISEPFLWESDYRAFSVSPSGYAQTIVYLDRQDELHQVKTLEQELEQLNQTRINLNES
jgi:REP element-mobilizing transposase RayT